MPDPQTPRPEMERRLGRYYAATPRPGFERELERKLMEAANTMSSDTPLRPASRARRFLQLGFSLAGLALIVVFLALALQVRPQPSSGPSPAATLGGVAPGATAEPTGTPFPTATPNNLTAPRRLAAGVCPTALPAATPDTSGPPADPHAERLAAEDGGERIAGGQAITEGFTFDLRLVCDPAFRPDSPDWSHMSEFEHLGIAASWSYDGAPAQGETAEFAGLQPYVTMQSTLGPALERTTSSSLLQGIQYPNTVFVDFPGGDLVFSYVVKVHTPDDRWAGAELRFTLRPEADGYRPVEVTVRPLDPAAPAANATPGADGGYTLLPTLAPEQVNPALGRLAGLLGAWEARTLNAAGWLQYAHRIENRLPGFLLNGDELPTDYRDESWYLLDDRGYVQRSITRQLDAQGNLLQAIVMSDGQYRNLTLGESDPSGDPWRPGLGFGFYEEAAQAVRQGVAISETMTTLDGAPAVQFTLDYRGYRAQMWIDPQSGAPRMYEHWASPGPGAPLALEQRITILTVERADAPPDDLLALFEATPAPFRPADPVGTPAPQGFDPAQSYIGMKMVPGDSPDRPGFWYGDLYALDQPAGEDGMVNDANEGSAGGYLLGRVDFGAVPGGWCDRSADGGRIAFNWVQSGVEMNSEVHLRWFDLAAPGLVHEPDPDLRLRSAVSFAPSGHTVAAFGCKGEACGLYLIDLTEQDAPARLLTGALNGVTPLTWKPDGSQIAGESLDAQGNVILSIVDAQTGEILYQGPAAGSPFESWGVAIIREMSGFGRCTAP